jgi:hypothetical protein
MRGGEVGLAWENKSSTCGESRVGLDGKPLMHSCYGSHRVATDLSHMHQRTLGAFCAARFHITAQ